MNTLLSLHEAVRHGDFGLIMAIVPQLPILFWGGKSSNYGPEMLYLSWLLHPDVVTDQTTREAIIKSGLVHCTTAGSGFKAIDLALEHINATYALDIKRNKNSTHDINKTFSRLALNGNFLAITRKSIESIFKSKQKGTHTAGDATTDIISYAIKLYRDGITKRQPTPGGFDVPDIKQHGGRMVLKHLRDWNEVVPFPDDAAEQFLLPGLGDDDTGEVDFLDEGERLFDEPDDGAGFWDFGLADMGLDL
jgi:hypothetical protein